MTAGQAEELIAVLAAAYPVPAWPAETVMLFASEIEDLDYATTAVALQIWRRSQRDRPTIFDIRNASKRQLAAAGAIPHELDPDEAWGYVVKQFTDPGSYRSFPTDHYPEVAAIVERIGWETLCRSDNPEADRAHFLRLFEHERGRVREARTSAPGLRKPDDVERLMGQGAVIEYRRAPILSLPKPTEAERSANLSNIREIIASLGPVAPTHAQPAPVGPVDFIIETPEMIEAARRRKTEMLAALGVPHD